MTNGNDFIQGSTVVRCFGENETRMECENTPLTKREYFAAMAMQGLLAHHGVVSIGKESIYTGKEMAIDAAFAADVLIEALNKEGDDDLLQDTD